MLDCAELPRDLLCGSEFVAMPLAVIDTQGMADQSRRARQRKYGRRIESA